jgi:flavin reductase (DIM6/NTAB) family NADH-FMN oxidoreductase RutF
VDQLDAGAFRSVLRRFATGVAVVTTWDGERPWGTTVNSFNSVSLRPPLVMVAFDRSRRIVPALTATGRYAVNILGEDGRALSDCFAGGPNPALPDAAPDRDDFCGTDWLTGPTGLPLVRRAIAWLECTIVDTHAAGDHDLYIARVDAAGDAVGDADGADGAEADSDTGAETDREGSLPLIYYSGRYLRIERASVHELEGKPER